MSQPLYVAGTDCLSGGEHISRLVETHIGKKNFLQSKNFL